MRFNKLIRVVCFAIVMITIGSCSINRKIANSQIVQEEFVFSFEEPFATDLKYYDFALSYWQVPSIDSLYTLSFPSSLDDDVEYELFFIPRVMQGNSSFLLKMKFDKHIDAVEYFNNKTSCCVKKSFNGVSEVSMDLCYPDSEYFESKYELNSNCSIKFFSTAYCSSHNDGDYYHEIGGVDAGISLEEDKGIVMCWAVDYTM